MTTTDIVIQGTAVTITISPNDIIVETTIQGAAAVVAVTPDDIAAARASLRGCGTPGDGFWDIAASSYVTAAEHARDHALPDTTPAQIYNTARRAAALRIAYTRLAGGAR